jgi:ABC-type polysaccharide/polyol phosphate transport system, ATPase component
MNPAISVENLSKRYIIGHQRDARDGLRHALEDAFRNPFKWLLNRKKQITATREEFWALKQVSFTINDGDVVGVIGRNGAGKSTLLKVLSRITEPTEGRVRIKGRVASLLEVGTGFHQELTGRENIFLNGAILGMTKAEIKRKFDEIVAFSEIEKFLDTPVKRYSSGMYVRLAFAVAAHLEPEILIVDEVLAVGDAQFQKKCLGKMKNVATEGRTVLFVSHNMAAVSSLCGTAVWLKDGKLNSMGPTRQIMDKYLTSSSEAEKPVLETSEIPRIGDFGRRIKIEKLEWLTELPIQNGERLRTRIHFQALQDVEDVSVGLGFSTLEGVRLLSYDTDFQDGYRPSLKKGTRWTAEMSISSLPLAPGIYSIDIGSRSGDSFGLDYLPNVCQMEISIGKNTPSSIVRDGAGVRLTSEWKWSSETPESEFQAVS